MAGDMTCDACGRAGATWQEAEGCAHFEALCHECAACPWCRSRRDGLDVTGYDLDGCAACARDYDERWPGLRARVKDTPRGCP